MPSYIVVIGTDTGVGKTFVGCLLARALTARGQSVVAIKPVETGCGAEPSPDEDGVRLARATGQATPNAALQRFRDPVTPAIAAEREGRPLKLGPLVAAIEQASGRADIALIEGAGGLFSPVAWDWDLIDLCRALDAGVLLVTADRLGCINHTVLTLNALDRAELRTLGVVVSMPETADASTGSNAAVITKVAPSKRVTMLPRRREPDPADPPPELLEWLAR